ncbi:MAG TPA: replication initiator protein WhiP [Pyrodictium sp.]|nr:replication initiator protein WhiP [Pyrodictium sp.]
MPEKEVAWNLTEQKERYRREQGPRSPLVEAIAVLLLARPMRAAEIAQTLGYPTRYISSYLSYWKARGYFENVSGYWQLTAKGEEFARQVIEKRLNGRVSQFAALARQIIEDVWGEQIKQTRNRKRVGKPAEQSSQFLPFIAADKGKSGNKRKTAIHPIHCLASIIDVDELSDEELEILEIMINHYVKWGSTYMYIDQLQQKLDADPAWLLKVLKSLQSKGIIYIYNDRRLGTRIGFSKRLRDQITTCKP